MKRPPEDSALPPELQAELERSRSAGHDYDVLGKLPQLRAALDAAPLMGHTHGASSTFAAGWKLTLVSAALGGVMFGAWSVLQRPSPPPPPAARVEQQPSAPAMPEPEAVAPLPAAIEPIRPEPAATSQPATRSSRREIAQLVRIRALLEQDPEAAYRLAQRSDQEFPRGVLSEERKALQVVALAKRGTPEAAQRKAREFFAAYPQSPMRDLVESALRAQPGVR
ncbi:MAG TPA: hypothetical protein VJR89_06350 [Polyangiales bacterium]|nr:hypothetical protein [Polyangiales bacterium]